MQALGSGYSLGYLISGIASLVACVLTALVLRSKRGEAELPG
ncbi:MAG: hypothetical protein ACRDN0_08015 [Trebonia sp.]